MEENNASLKIRPWLLSLVFPALASIIGLTFANVGLKEVNIVVVYILFVLLTARLTDKYQYGLLSSFLSTLAFNYLFTEPYYTFSVSDPGYIVTFLIMTVTSIITSTSTSMIKKSAAEAHQQRLETEAVYQLASLLTDAKDIHAIAKIATETISNRISFNVGCLCFDENGVPENSFIEQRDPKNQVYREVINSEELMHRIEMLRTLYSRSAEYDDWPIYGQDNILGVIRVPGNQVNKMSSGQVRLLQSMIEIISLAMDRFREKQKLLKSHEAMVKERYRGNLLRSISHDLRTPLAGIMGSSEILIDTLKDNDYQLDLVQGIYNDATLLHSLVENILSLTKVQEGKLNLNLEYQSIEEIIESALKNFTWRMPNYIVTVDIPDSLLMVPMDGKLIIQVLINLLDNAMKHTNEGEEIIIRVRENNFAANTVTIAVIDSGPGIDESNRAKLFEMFYTANSKHSDATHGVGLGLSICDAIVSAHGGSITAFNRKDQSGAVFEFTLPNRGNEHGRIQN